MWMALRPKGLIAVRSGAQPGPHSICAYRRISLDFMPMPAQHTAAPLLDRLRQRGMRITAQRRALASVLHGPNVHLTADEIFDRARHELPEISRATVYNTIHELTRLGELLELSLDGRSKRYDPNVQPGHHHFVCRSCAAIHDVNMGQPAPALDGQAHPELHADTAHIVYGGLCAACS